MSRQRIKFTESGGTQRGFTLVELLVVIVVIAILATITIVSYNGVTAKAHAVALQGDLKQGSTALGLAQATNGAYPTDQTSAGLKSSSGDTLTYNASGDGTNYCLQASGWGITYVISDANSAPALGYCSGTVAVAGTPPVPNGGVVTTLENNLGPTGVAVNSTGSVFAATGPSSDACIATVTMNNYSSFAGNCYGSSSGNMNGTGTSASFSDPTGGITVDSAGNLYFADSGNNCIRKITPAAVVTWYVGYCTGFGGTPAGYADGTGYGAQFNDPSDVAVDASGNVFITDESNNCIREAVPNVGGDDYDGGIASTFVGTCATNGSTAGYADGTGSAAKFDRPTGLTVDPSGTIYVADSGNNCIRKITAGGVVSTFAGTCNASGSTAGYADGTGSAAKFNKPYDVAVDSFGTVYVSDYNNKRIREITPAGVVSTLAGSGTAGSTNGTGTAAKFNDPEGITVTSSRTIYVADFGNGSIRVIK